MRKFYSNHLGRTRFWALGEMDIILVFETSGVGSIPTGPTKNILQIFYKNS